MDDNETNTTLTALIFGGLIALVISVFAFGDLPGQKVSPTSTITLDTPDIPIPAPKH